jgi:thiol:disulfide interchange protein
MIPINIAILGAGTQAKSKLRGLLLGTTYGAGIAVAYGVLGLLVVLTGARFGALNSSPWFNFGIAALFVVLSLSMFGVFNIDLSRFQGGSGKQIKGGRFMTAFGLGLVAALLAGACVAPVVISVLLYSTTLYADGNAAALLLPFLLGLGIAFPWPFAGAGLSFLPKAGAWMEKVKYVFGIIILLAALYYAKLGYSLLKSGRQTAEPDPVAAEKAILQHAKDGWVTSLDEAIAQSQSDKKPIFIDFWAVWCKSCLKMDKTTFKDPQVLERLDGYVKLKMDADKEDPATAYAMDRFVEVGLPTYVIIDE